MSAGSVKELARDWMALDGVWVKGLLIVGCRRLSRYITVMVGVSGLGNRDWVFWDDIG